MVRVAHAHRTYVCCGSDIGGYPLHRPSLQMGMPVHDARWYQIVAGLLFFDLFESEGEGTDWLLPEIMIRHGRTHVLAYLQALNVLVHGRKKWTILPPRHSLYSKQHMIKWNVQELPRLHSRVMHCVQEAGDILFVPEQWSVCTFFLVMVWFKAIHLLLPMRSY